jgi:hypothetical protein
LTQISKRLGVELAGRTNLEMDKSLGVVHSQA